MDKLKPCQFCGGEAEVIPHKFFCSDLNDWKTESYGVACKSCNTYGYQFFGCKRHAIKAWNRRINDASVVHEKWLLDRWPSWPHRECSRCKIMIPRTKEVADQYWQYCPNCGERRDGGAEGE